MMCLREIFFNGYCVKFSELLLSAEANIVTYVDRQGGRSKHILKEVMETGILFLKLITSNRIIKLIQINIFRSC